MNGVARTPLALALGAVVGAVGIGPGRAEAKGGRADPKPAGAPADLRGAPIRDLPTTLSVALSPERNLVLELPARFWIQCPRHLEVATSLAGDGLIAQYLNPRGGSTSMLYVGSVPLHAAADAETEGRRAERTARDFAANLAAHYARVDWTLLDAPVALSPATLRVGGRKADGWRTARYRVRPREYAGPESTFTGECVFFRPEGAERLAYVALDAKAGGTTLDAAVVRLAVRSPVGLHPTGRRLQLNDLAESTDPGRFPLRLLAMDLPAGFVPTPAVARVGGEWVYVEERLDAAGRVDAVVRLRQHPRDPDARLEDDLGTERAAWHDAELTPTEEVPLAVAGHRALAFSHPAPGEAPGVRAHTAVLHLDDLVLVLTWTTRAPGPAADRDRAAFLSMLRTIEMAVRW